MEENKIFFGFTPSVIDGTERQFEAKKNMPIPTVYDYRDFLSPVINQGKESTCVPSSISAHLNWNYNVDNAQDNNQDNGVYIHGIYDKRENRPSEGMTFKDAFHILRHDGVDTNNGVVKIDHYAQLRSIDSIKQALILNGPCVGAFMVYNMTSKFWDKEYKFEGNYGGHAISIVGYDEEGFIIRNSWGSGWGNAGYTTLPYEQFNQLLECWTIVD